MLSLKQGHLRLDLTRIIQADYRANFCPTHHFDMMVRRTKVGELRFRIGQSKQLCVYAGQIGYSVIERYRGRRYASKALQAVLPHCFSYFPSIFITCDPDNIASIKTIESCRYIFHGTVAIPKNNRMYREGSAKRRYELLPE